MERFDYSPLIGLPHAAMPCYELVRAFHRMAGIHVAAEPDPREWEEVAGEPQWGDVIGSWNNTRGVVESVGIYVEDRRVLTSPERRNVCVVPERALLERKVAIYRRRSC